MLQDSLPDIICSLLEPTPVLLHGAHQCTLPLWVGVGGAFYNYVRGSGFACLGFITGFRTIFGFGALVRLVFRGGGDVRHDGRALGYLVASLDRARQFLDAGAHRYLFLRRTGGHLVRLPDPLHHAASRFDAAEVVGDAVGIPRAAGRVRGRVGRCRDADLGAVRRLVAQRLRARREDPESAAHGVGGRDDRGAPGCADPDSGADESRAGRGTGAIEGAVPVRGRDDSGLPHGAVDGTHLPQPDAHRALLSRGGDGGAGGAGGGGARQRISLGGHRGGGRLQRCSCC